MKKLLLENIQTEYHTFLEYFFSAESCLEELAEKTNKYLYKYSKSKHYNKYFAENIEINSLYFDNFLERMKNIIDDIESINILDLDEPKINNVKNIDKYIQFSNKYEEDIYVNINHPIDWTE